MRLLSILLIISEFACLVWISGYKRMINDDRRFWGVISVCGLIFITIIASYIIWR